MFYYNREKKTPMDIEETVKSIVAHKAPLEGLSRNTQLSSLGLDSLDLVEITLEIEDAFHINFTSGEIRDLKTINDAIELIERKTK